MKESNKRVLVGMSGGIDSTATCLMLQEQGYEIVGVTMRVWGDEPQDARELAVRMGIEHYVADERVPFKDTIVKSFIDEYRQGRTPNPCVMCNPLFKFRMLIEWADKLGCDWIATGHYSRLEERNGYIYIVAGDDEKKDQSSGDWGRTSCDAVSFLWATTPSRLCATICVRKVTKPSRKRGKAWKSASLKVIIGTFFVNSARNLMRRSVRDGLSVPKA